MPTGLEPALYGIINSNRRGDALWGKNQFNSSFPVALACYMRDNNINPVYLSLDNLLRVVANPISFDDVFNTNLSNRDLLFSFETKYEPYQTYSHDDIGGIDLVIQDNSNRQFIRPLEIKLTVLPDNTTCRRSEENWSSEIVIRPASTKYCALGIIDSCSGHLDDIREIFEPVCHDIQDWGNKHELLHKFGSLLDCIDIFQRTFYESQKPLLMQPIWKTKGKSPQLAEHAFDIFIWSDLALSRLFLDNSRASLGQNIVNRQMRSAARLARFLFDVSRSRTAPLTRIYTEMAFGLQTDKEFAVNGLVTSKYINSPRRITPSISKNVLPQIILNGGEKKLSPERRFDQTIYYTVANISQQPQQTDD